ncbi:MAG TPA: hypothetical protein DCS67_07905 [Clostridiales bacterium UBA8960]|nr:hypothetical protein [Clostridiales bacterium UBA8960]
MSIELLEDLYDKLYEFAVRPEYNESLIRAEKKFILNEDQTDTDGFAEWFIFNYVDPNTEQRLINLFNAKEASSAHLDAIKRSKRCLYEVRKEHEKTALKDLFSGEDYMIDHINLGNDQIVSARIVHFEHHNYIVGDLFEMEMQYKDSIKKYLLDQYNQYVTAFGLTTLDDFFDYNAHLIYKVMGIINTVSEENAYDDALMLYQTTYAFKCAQDALYDQLMTLKSPVYADEDDEPILRVMNDDTIIAEIEITNGMFYVLCNDEKHSEVMLALMKPLLNEEIVFVKSETLTLEDIL